MGSREIEKQIVNPGRIQILAPGQPFVLSKLKESKK